MSEATRRGFLGLAAASAAGALVAPGVHLIEPAQAAPGAGANPAVRWGMLIDTDKCATGCSECVSACNTENGIAPARRGTDSQWIRIVALEQAETGRRAQAPVLCQHCAQPPCVEVCPTGASFKRTDGIVLVDRHLCIGCRYCMMACPYKARSFVHEPLTGQKPDVPRGQGCVESCTFCVQRLDRGEQTTACEDACTAAGHDAIVFGNLNDPASAIARRLREARSTALRADLALDPAVRYEGL